MAPSEGQLLDEMSRRLGNTLTVIHLDKLHNTSIQIISLAEIQ